jgi:hypothetical protein
MCARRVYRNLLITLLLFAFLGPAPCLLAASRGIQVVSGDGQSLYLYKDYQAVVIGVSDYDHWPKLPNAVKDSQQVAGKLTEMGFKVKLIANPDSRQLKSTLTEIARRLGTEKNRALLLYYAGHGETTRLADGTELGYIIPKDCPLQILDPFGFDAKAVSMKEIEMLALKVKSKHMLAVFDSCFSGSLFALSRAAPTDITEKSAKSVRQFMTAGGANETVPDRSIFKICFLQGLDGEADYNRDRYITGSELGLYLQTKVINYTRGAQHPQYGKINNPHLDKGDFIFVLKSSERKAFAKVASVPSYDSDKKQSVEELERLRREREELEARMRLLEERRRLKGQEELAYAPETVTSARLFLRKESKTLYDSDVKEMLKKNNFFESRMNVEGSFRGDLVDNGNGTITDRATGLMWEKSGSQNRRTMTRAKWYIKKLNEDKLAGYSDWRLPTIDELASLLKKDKTHGMHIDSLFDRKQKSCWSSDSKPDVHWGEVGLMNTWITDFTIGRVQRAQWATVKDNQIDREIKLDRNYVRAVRSLK